MSFPVLRILAAHSTKLGQSNSSHALRHEMSIRTRVSPLLTFTGYERLRVIADVYIVPRHSAPDATGSAATLRYSSRAFPSP
jgi:hypothetical protein